MILQVIEETLAGIKGRFSNFSLLIIIGLSERSTTPLARTSLCSMPDTATIDRASEILPADVLIFRNHKVHKVISPKPMGCMYNCEPRSRFGCCSMNEVGGVPFAVAFFHAEWATKCATAFVVACLSSGLLYGIIYILLLRAIRVNRQTVEAWLEHQRQRLASGPVPVIETLHPIMLSALYAIYGRGIARRFGTSFCIGLLFSGIVFGVLYYEYRQVPLAVRLTKVSLERKVDPFLYKYATTPELASDYAKAFEKQYIPPQDDRGMGTWLLKYDDPLSLQIRKARYDYDSHFLAAMSGNADRVSLTLLHLFEGDPYSPGLRGADACDLFIFNVLLDFVSITIVIESLRWLGRDLSFGRAGLSFFMAGAGTVICCLTSFLSYSMFLRGNTRFFVQLLLWMPLSLGALAAAIAACGGAVYALIRKVEDTVLLVFGCVLSTCLLGAAGIYGIRTIWGDWRYGLNAGIPWRDFPHPPYVLALTTFIPAALVSLAFGLVLIGKLAAEPTRIIPEAYMTFVKEEVGGTHAYGIIALLGLITGAIAGLIWASS